jgi:hypothetical protein
MRVDSLRSVGNPDQNSANPCALSDGEASKVTRLEFRSSGVVQQRQGELLLRDFIATDSALIEFAPYGLFCCQDYYGFSLPSSFEPPSSSNSKRGSSI